MTIQDPDRNQFGELRARAAQILQGEEIDVSAYSIEDLQRLLYELRVYHVELELQNDELRSTQQQLAQARDKYSDLYHFAPIAYVTFNQEGIIQELNLAAANLFGRERSHLINIPFITMLSQESYRPFRLLLNSVLETEEPQHRELLIRRRDGTTIPVEVEASAPRNSDIPNQCRMMFIDITERKQAEEAILRAQKMESLSVLAGGVAHDFNNLLVAIQNQMELARHNLQGQQSEKIRQADWHLLKAISATERAADLTRQLMAYSGRANFRIHLVNLNELIQDNLNLFHSSSGNRVNLNLNLSPTLPMVEVDTGQIQQVIMNLIINAVEAIGDHSGEILVSTDISHVREEDIAYWQIDDSEILPGTYVRLTVRDSGKGMASDTLRQIFDPFFTTKVSGRGLGLAAVHGIIKGHNGGIHVDSRPAVGTTFQLLLPASQQLISPQPETADILPTPYETSQKVVLVIDDEIAVREAVIDILDVFNQKAIAAPNGETGIEMFKKWQQDIQLVLLDLTMPGFSGIETLKHIRKIDLTVPVLLSSGYTEEDLSPRFTELGVAGFLQKPYSVQGLIQAIQPYLKNE